MCVCVCVREIIRLTEVTLTDHRLYTEYVSFVEPQFQVALLAGAVEYTNYISAEG